MQEGERLLRECLEQDPEDAWAWTFLSRLVPLDKVGGSFLTA